MLPRMLFALLTVPIFAVDIPKPSGVPPALLPQYVPIKSGSSLTWKCLDGSKTIDWSDVNNDYCDCSDGSDEPGTGACEGTTFYCANEGHIGTIIPSSRVNDGKCDPACCDGSDEPSGVCKNTCKEAGEAYRAERDAKRRIQKKGAKIRASYISFAQNEKTRIEALISTSTREIASREVEVARLKDIADRTESLSAAALEHKQRSPLYTSLIAHNRALKSLQHQHEKHLEREKALGDILDALRTGYNPNYQDMAVLEAVRGWEFLAGLEHINEVGKDGGETKDGEDEEKSEEDINETKEDGEDGLFTEEELGTEIGQLLDTDHVSLLLEHEKHVNSPSAQSTLFDLSLYIPDSYLPQYEAFKDTLLSWLQAFGVISGRGDSSTDSSRARKAYENAEHSLTLTKDEKKDAEQDLVNLFDVAHFGSQGEWKKLDGTCLEKDTGDYTYEVCLFDEARQKPTRGGSGFSLGKWSSWNTSPDVTPGDLEYYTKQVYQNGAQCWNGPQRSVVILLACGVENAIDSVVELQKCEYQFTGTSPALCLPLDSSDGNGERGKDEL